jgi:hypothetical protein
MHIIPQRGGVREGEDDCVLASLATILEITYEQAAIIVGVKLRHDGLPLTGDLSFGELAAPLFRRGISIIHFFSKDHPALNARSSPTLMPTSTEIASLMKGHVGLVGAPIEIGGKVVGHSFAWDGERLFDCRNGMHNFQPPLGTIWEAIVLADGWQGAAL